MKDKNIMSRLFVILVIVYLLIPLVATFIYSVFDKWTGILPQQFTLRHYVDLLSDNVFLMSLFRTIIISIVPIIITIYAAVDSNGYSYIVLLVV